MEVSVFKKGMTVAAAVSGGMDSMVMLHWLNEVKQQAEFSLVVVNVNHNLRKAAKRDSAFVKAQAERLGLPFFGFSVNVKEFARQNKLSTETAARVLRYRCFESVAADVVALAHHAGDQAESVIMNIVRGSGTNGAAGMKTVNGRYVRPLLSVSKDEIKKRQAEQGIPFVEDKTNKKNIHTRNFVRNKIMPLLKKVNGRAEENIAKFALRLREDEEFLQQAAADSADETAVAAKLFAGSGSMWKRRTFSALAAVGAETDITSAHLDLIKELALNGRTGGSLDLPHGTKAVKDYGKVVFTRAAEALPKMQELPFKIGSYVSGGKLITVAQGEGRWKFDLDKLPADAVFRHRQEGDFFTKQNGGSKKLKDFLIDKKVPQRLRDSLIVLASGSEVLFCEGTEMNGKIWTDKNTKRVYNISVVKINFSLDTAGENC